SPLAVQCGPPPGCRHAPILADSAAHFTGVIFVPAMHDYLYLASQSPRRSELLTQLGVRYELLLANDDEDAEALEVVLPGETPDDYVQRVCALKAEAALRRRERRALPDAPVLTSDTTVCLGGRILGKPADGTDAAAMLGALSGTTH